MIRPLTCVCMLLASASGLYLYQAKHRTRMLDRQIVEIERDTRQVRARIETLKAEWALLNTPDRLNELAGRYLNLKPTAPAQFAAIGDLNTRLPAAGQAVSQTANPPETLEEHDPQPPSGPTVAPTAVPVARLDRTPHPQMARNTDPAAAAHRSARNEAARNDTARNDNGDDNAPRVLASRTPAPRDSGFPQAGFSQDNGFKDNAGKDVIGKDGLREGARLRLTSASRAHAAPVSRLAVNTGMGMPGAAVRQTALAAPPPAPRPAVLETAAHSAYRPDRGGLQRAGLISARTAPAAAPAPMVASALGVNRGASLPPPVPMGDSYSAQ